MHSYVIRDQGQVRNFISDVSNLNWEKQTSNPVTELVYDKI